MEEIVTISLFFIFWVTLVFSMIYFWVCDVNRNFQESFWGKFFHIFPDLLWWSGFSTILFCLVQPFRGEERLIFSLACLFWGKLIIFGLEADKNNRKKKKPKEREKRRPGLPPGALAGWRGAMGPVGVRKSASFRKRY